jgi:glycosyltransferase involved in cell wall biosynthesis
MTLHSFAILAYKESPYIEDCILSLKKQNVKSDMFIATSTPSDFLTQLAEKYNVPIFVTEPGKGIAHDWNFSLKQATTKYLTLAHQDDIYLPNYTENCIKEAENFNDSLICFTNYSEIVGGKDRDKTTLLKIKRLMLHSFMPFNKNIKRIFWKKRMISFGCPIAAPSVMYNLHNVGDFNFTNEFHINMDWDAWYRLTNMKGRFVYINQKLMKHRIHEESATTKGLQNNSRQKEDLMMFERLWPKPIAKLLAVIYAKSYSSNHKK